MADNKPKNTDAQTTVDSLAEQARGILEAGNARRFILKRKDGERIIDVPLTAAVVGGLIFTFWMPWLMVIGVIAGLYFKVSLEVVKVNDDTRNNLTNRDGDTIITVDRLSDDKRKRDDIV